MSGDKQHSSPRTVLDWPQDTGSAEAVLAEIERLRRLRRKQRMRLAGCATLSLVLAAGAWVGLRTVPSAVEPPAAGVSTRRVLADGSVAELKAGAEIAVGFTDAVRAVALVRGAAHFTVAKNAARPFVVTAGGIQVRAVGTAFEVDLGRTSIAVVVDEGRVAVEDAGAGEHEVLTYVSAGNRVVVDRPPAPSPGAALPAADRPSKGPGGPSAPAVPLLELAATPLSEVAMVFNRHSGKHVVLADPALGAVQLSGVLRADNVDALLTLLAANYGISPKIDGREIVLGRAP